MAVTAPAPSAASADGDGANADAVDGGGAESLEFFERKVRPLLAQRCLECHSGDHAKGSLWLDSKAGVLAGGDTGPAVVPGKPGESLLVDAVNYGDTYQMPPKSKLAADEVAVLTRWVELGIPWPEEAVALKVSRTKFDLAERRAAHWAWQPIGSPAPPAVADDGWPATPIDRFILARLEREGMHPAAAADRPALVRRLYFDLIGLPPSSEELAGALADESPQAIEHLVDRLLASQHFGERWGRHWLDLVRYCESRGQEWDPSIPNAWHYRDYVIRAINADVPYDRFLTEHLAGDLVTPPRLHPSEGFNESVLGTGFWLFEEAVHSPVDIRQDETDRIDSRLDVLTKAFLGLTVACARCHDHKFDAISQRDYYALAGFAVSGSYRQVRFETMERERQIAGELDRLRNSARADLLPQAAGVLRPAVDRLADYLLAAGEIVWPPAPADGAAAGQQPAAVSQVVATDAALASSAAARGLDARLLDVWKEQLTAAHGLADHPLHRFALAAASANRGAEPPASAEKPQPAAGATPLRVIVDYADPAAPWYADGFAFGLHAARPGDLLPAADPTAPLRLGTFAAARRDPAWLGLQNAPGSENDFDRLGGWERNGQMVRTPEVTLESGTLWYRVRGPGRAYAAVNSHLIVHGPLHGQTLLEWPAKKDGNNADDWQWIGHDLRSYAGHRAHVEFSPVGGASLEIAQVIESPDRPAFDEHDADAFGRILAADGSATPAKLAAAIQESFARVVTHLAEEQAAGQQAGEAALDRDEAALADWLLARMDVFAPTGSATGAERAAREQLTASTAAFRAAEAELAGQIPRVSQLSPAMLDGNGADEPLLIRGNPRTPGEIVPRRPLEAFAGSAEFQPGPGSGRLELARSLVAADNPLVARVIVNRIWHHLFGVGIVPSVDNFGLLGQPPSHPELLDYLAGRFVADGWSVKRLIRELVLSRTYQMSSYPDAADEQDPNDVLLHRMRLRRLEGEAIRDAILTVSGGLNRRHFGPSERIYLTADLDGRGRPASGPLDGAGRRSIYLSVRRNFLSPMMLVFDLPIPATTAGRRNVSNVPAQALILLNDPFVDEQALVWARRVLKIDLSPAERIGRLYEAALGRPAEPGEVEAALQFIHQQAEELNRPDAWQTDERAWADLAHVLWNSKEFLFVR